MSDPATRGALVADFHRYYGVSLKSVRHSGIPLSEVADMAIHLPPDSATRRALDPHWQRTNEVDFLRAMEHTLRILVWQNNASKTAKVPERIPLPWDPKEDGTIEVDRMTLEEADDFLGWTEEMKEASRGR